MSTGRDESGMDRDGNGKERRAAAGHRVVFEALVAVGGRGAGFEAESVDVSPDGMRLRTAYLPMPGDVLSCRFDVGTGEIAVKGEVVWCNEEARGGEFGLSFVDLDDATARALRLLMIGDEPAADATADAPEPPPSPAATKGNRVRLHIEGLGSPMKARVRDADVRTVHVGSALEFLKVGRTLELEDVDRGARREAWVDDVKVEVDPQSSVPQLVVSLRFDAIGQTTTRREPAVAKVTDEAAEPAPTVTRSARPPARSSKEEAKPAKVAAESKEPREGKETAPATKRAGASVKPPAEADVAAARGAEEEDELEAMRRGRLHDVGDKLKSGATAAMDKIAPAMSGLGERARSLWGKAQEGIQRRRETKEADKPRRVTAPPPSGALKASGRKVVRSEEEEAPESAPPPRTSNRKRTAAIGAVVGLVAVMGFWGLTRGGDEASPMTAAELRASEKAPAEKAPPIPGAAAVADVPLFGATPLATTEQVVMPPAAISGQPAAGTAPDGDEGDGESAEESGKPDAPAQRSWGHGEVKNAKVLRLKMDGPVVGIQGQEVDGGFQITVPGRKSTASASSLARKDKRIDALDVVNKEDGAVVTLKFKGDEIPGYLATVKGDRLEIAIGGGGPAKGKGEPAKKVAAKSKKKDDKKKKP